MRDGKVAFLCPSYGTYWIQIFESFDSLLGNDFTVVTQSIQEVGNAKIAQGMGTFQRKIVAGRRISISDRNSEEGQGTPFGLNIAPMLPWTLFRIRPRVVIASNFGLWTMLAIIMRYPTVLFWEGTVHTERTVRPWRLRIRRWISRRARAFVVNGSAAKQYLNITLNVPLEKLFVGSLCSEPPPADAPLLAQRARQENRPTSFLYVGRLIRGKGVDHLLRAAAQLNLAIAQSTFTVTIVGDGPQKAELEALALSLGIGHLTDFVGAVHPNEVWSHYRNSDVFVLPTLHDNWPLVVMEAMSVGLPILLSEFAGSLPDLIREGENGHGFTPSDHSHLAALMAAYVSNPALIDKQGRKSIEVAKQYSADRSVNAFMQATVYAMQTAPQKSSVLR